MDSENIQIKNLSRLIATGSNTKSRTRHRKNGYSVWKSAQ